MDENHEEDKMMREVRNFEEYLRGDASGESLICSDRQELKVRATAGAPRSSG